MDTYISEWKAVLASHVWFYSGLGQCSSQKLDMLLFVKGDVLEMRIVGGVVAGIHELLLRQHIESLLVEYIFKMFKLDRLLARFSVWKVRRTNSESEL
jgi:hypothetical protein